MVGEKMACLVNVGDSQLLTGQSVHGAGVLTASTTSPSDVWQWRKTTVIDAPWRGSATLIILASLQDRQGFQMLNTRVLPSLLRTRSCLSFTKLATVPSVSSGVSPSPRFCSTKRIRFTCGKATYDATAKLGDTLLEVVLDNNFPFVGFGACGGMRACCTCHVILAPEHFERVDRINPASQEELDLLDMAPDLCDYSRLACQIQIEKRDVEPILVTVPLHNVDLRDCK